MSLLNIAISESAAPKIQNAASLVVSTIASVDYPDEWPDILQKLLQNISQAGPNSLHGSLKVLSELVEDGFDQEQFFAIAQDLANVLHQVAVSEAALSSRALAVQVFRGCFDILEMVLEDHKTAVKQFAEQVVGEWMPFLLHISQTRLPQRPEEVKGDSPYSGLVKLKTQVMKVSGTAFDARDIHFRSSFSCDHAEEDHHGLYNENLDMASSEFECANIDIDSDAHTDLVPQPSITASSSTVPSDLG